MGNALFSRRGIGEAVVLSRVPGFAQTPLRLLLHSLACAYLDHPPPPHPQALTKPPLPPLPLPPHTQVLTKAAARSKQRMREGREPECLLDFWSQQVLLEVAEAEEQGLPPPFYSADEKMADGVMDFLFASQDASTASLVWTITLMAEHPEVLAKVRTTDGRRQKRPL